MYQIPKNLSLEEKVKNIIIIFMFHINFPSIFEYRVYIKIYNILEYLIIQKCLII